MVSRLNDGFLRSELCFVELPAVDEAASTEMTRYPNSMFRSVGAQVNDLRDPNPKILLILDIDEELGLVCGLRLGLDERLRSGIGGGASRLSGMGLDPKGSIFRRVLKRGKDEGLKLGEGSFRVDASTALGP